MPASDHIPVPALPYTKPTFLKQAKINLRAGAIKENGRSKKL
jgi:hypothetical protein